MFIEMTLHWQEYGECKEKKISLNTLRIESFSPTLIGDTEIKCCTGEVFYVKEPYDQIKEMLMEVSEA